MTILKVTRYQTKDSKLHKTEKDAKDHVVNNVCEFLNKQLKPLTKDNCGISYATDLHKIILHLAGDYNIITKFIAELNKVYENIYIED